MTPTKADPGPYPIPANAPIEQGPAPSSTGDRHILMVDRDNWILYELYAAYPPGTGWTAGSGAISNWIPTRCVRPAGPRPMLPGCPYSPVWWRHQPRWWEQKQILHAVRFTVCQLRHAYIPPATHYASSKTADTLPPMGMRVRLKASVDISGYSANTAGDPQGAQDLRHDHGRQRLQWYVSGAPDSRFDDDELNTLKQIVGSDFEVVKMRGIITQ